MAMYKKALGIRIAALGQDHPTVGDSYYNMALCRQQQLKAKEARQGLTQSTEVYAVAYGPDHEETRGAPDKAAWLTSPPT